MHSLRMWCLSCCVLMFALLVSDAARAQFIQGTDQGSILMTDPDNWTRTVIDTQTPETVTFYLNPCEYILYWDTAGAPQTCLPRASEELCGKIDEMEAKLEQAIEVWESLGGDLLTIEYGGILGGSCPTDVNNCPATDGWDDDGDWVVTRTYIDDLDEQECPNAATGAEMGGAGFRLFDDGAGDHTTRWIRQCDIVFNERAWDTSPEHGCRQAGLDIITCAKATTMALGHEVGHCLGFGHAYATRKSLDPLESTLAGVNLELLEGLPSLMSYDRPGSIDVFDNGLTSYDLALYLYTYSSSPDPNDDYFAAFGTVVTDADNDCTPLTDPQPVFGAGVVALDATATTVRPVHISISGVDPLGDGQFRLEHLDRGGGSKDYRLLVVDVRDANQFNANGWDYDDMTEQAVPALPVFRTDQWDETHAGSAYKYETSAQFATGFGFVLTAKIDAPASGNHDAGQICVEF